MAEINIHIPLIYFSLKLLKEIWLYWEVYVNFYK